MCVHRQNRGEECDRRPSGRCTEKLWCSHIWCQNSTCKKPVFFTFILIHKCLLYRAWLRPPCFQISENVLRVYKSFLYKLKSQNYIIYFYLRNKEILNLEQSQKYHIAIKQSRWKHSFEKAWSCLSFKQAYLLMVKRNAIQSQMNNSPQRFWNRHTSILKKYFLL